MAEVAVKRINKSKAKGNLFENKIAKELGEWIFKDKYMLGRHITSGAQKYAWVGDITPLKQLPTTFNNGKFPFIIECKNGYKNQISNLNNQSIIRQWLTKLLTEVTPLQNIIYLIVLFHGYSPLLITDVPFKLTASLILNLEVGSKVIPFYIYDFRDILEYDFFTLYNYTPELIKRLNSK